MGCAGYVVGCAGYVGGGLRRLCGGLHPNNQATSWPNLHAQDKQDFNSIRNCKLGPSVAILGQFTLSCYLSSSGLYFLSGGRVVCGVEWSVQSQFRLKTTCIGGCI